MRTSKAKRKHPAKQKKKTAGSQCSPDGQLEIRGREVSLHGQLAEQMAASARRGGITIQEVFEQSLRAGVQIIESEHRAKAKAAKVKTPKTQRIESR